MLNVFTASCYGLISFSFWYLVGSWYSMPPGCADMFAASGIVFSCEEFRYDAFF